MFAGLKLFRRALVWTRAFPVRGWGSFMVVMALILMTGIGDMAGQALPRGDTLRGKRLYLTYCSSCHGTTGQGDGPAAMTILSGFGRRPRNLTDDAYLSRKTDRQLSEAIKWSGKKEKQGELHPMPRWGLKLADREVANLVAYIRVLHRSPRLQGNPVSGNKLYSQFCAPCHGATGRGDAPMAKEFLAVSPRDFTNQAIMARVSDRDLSNAIKLGGPPLGRSAWMPGWAGAFTDQEVGDLVAFIRTLVARRRR